MKNRDSPISHGHEQQDNDLHEDDFDESLFSQQRRQKLFQGECSFPSNGQGVSVSATCGLRLLTTLSQMEMGKGSGKSSFSDLAGFTIKVVIRTSGYPSETRYRSTMSNLGDHTHHRLSFKAFFHASLKPFRDTVPFV